MKDLLIETIQKTLKASGLNPGPTDGIWGPLTRRAVEDWQRKWYIPVSGQLDGQTLKSLGIEAPQPILWLDTATRLMGLKEGKGAADNPTILDWADDLDLHYPHDDIAWCGLFVAHCISTTLPDEPLPANPLGARQWNKFGQPVAPQLGAIATFWRGSRDGWQGHVGFLVAASPSAYCVRGGNQSDSVSDAWISADRLLHTRWPSSGSIPFNRPLPTKPAGRLSTNEA